MSSENKLHVLFDKLPVIMDKQSKKQRFTAHKELLLNANEVWPLRGKPQNLDMRSMVNFPNSMLSYKENFLSLHLKKHRNFKGNMRGNRTELSNNTLRHRIDVMPKNRVLFRTDFPDYHPEYVGETLAELTNEGVLVKLAQGIYAKPRKSRFGIVLPSIEEIAQAIAVRDHTKVLPSGLTALNVLGLSTQVPMRHIYLTTGSERIIRLENQQLVLKHGVPKNFCYNTRLIALLTQALKELKKENVGQEELQIIRSLIIQEPNKKALAKDVDRMPAWMKRIVKPMLN